MGLFKRGSIPRNRQGAVDSSPGRKPEAAMVIRYGNTIKGTVAGQDNIFIHIIGKIRVRTEFDNLHRTAGHHTDDTGTGIQQGGG